jgi:UDP-N-acetylmuramyl pentapeptide synthase
LCLAQPSQGSHDARNTADVSAIAVALGVALKEQIEESIEKRKKRRKRVERAGCKSHDQKVEFINVIII